MASRIRYDDAGRASPLMKRVSWPGVIVVAGSTMYSWFNATPQVSPAPRGSDPAARPEATASAAGLEASAAAVVGMQLHDWSSKAPVHPRPDRNIFAFTRPAPKLVTASPPAAGLLAPPGESQPSPLAQFKLIGVAEDAGPDTPDGPGETSRTAIISGQGQLYIVKEGETVAWIYRVGRMSAGSVELLDTTGGSTVRLVLK